MNIGQSVKVVKSTYFFSVVGAIGTISDIYPPEHGIGQNRLYAVSFREGESVLFRDHELEVVEEGVM
jgi:hypothetical protein